MIMGLIFTPINCIFNNVSQKILFFVFLSIYAGATLTSNAINVLMIDKHNVKHKNWGKVNLIRAASG